MSLTWISKLGKFAHRENNQLYDDDFDNDFKIVPFIGVEAIPAGQTITFSKLKENLLQKVHGYV